jgi:hypothetical protein
LIDYLRFYFPLKNISLIWRRHHCRWKAAKFRHMLGAQGLWARKDLNRATPAVTRGLGFYGVIRKTSPFSRHLRHTRGCRGSILTQILTGTYTYEMKWLRSQRLISLKIQVGNTNRRNRYANTDPMIYWRWDQVPRRSKRPLLINHTRRELSSIIMNGELSAVKVSVPSTV